MNKYHKFDRKVELLISGSFQQLGYRGIRLEELQACQNVLSSACDIQMHKKIQVIITKNSLYNGG